MPSLATLILFFFPLLGQTTADPPADVTSAEQIAAAVRRLSSDDFTIREQATEELWRAGRAAQPALEAAAKGNDLEVALRARSVLERLRFGIFPDTPPETLGLIAKFRSGGEPEKFQALEELQKARQWSTLVALVKAETSPALRGRFARSFDNGLRRGAHQELHHGELDRAEELLAWTAELDEYGAGLRDYAALLLARRKLASAIDRLKEAGTYREDQATARILARLLQVQGNVQEARSIAELTDDKYLKADVYYRLEDWQAVTKLIPGDEGVENLGFAATFHRLAGNADASEQAVGRLRALANQEPARTWMCAEALMINGRWKDALELLVPANKSGAFELLCGQLKFADAFRLAGIDDPRGGAATWFARRASELDPASQEASAHFYFGLTVARTLNKLGERDEAVRLLAEAARQPDDDFGSRSSALVRMEEELGLFEQAKMHARDKLRKERGASQVMFGWYGEEKAYAAAWWWKFLCRIAPEEDRAVTLARLQGLMRGDGLKAGESLAELARRAEQASAELKLEERIAALGYIGQVCALQGELKLAREYWEKQARLAQEIPVSDFEGYNPPRTVSPLLGIGELYAQEKDWLEAAAAYGRAWQLQKDRAASLFLQGHALDQAGKHDEGRRLMDLACLLPLANTERREELAETMEKLGLREEALAQWELIIRLGAFEGWEGADDWAVKRACRVLAEHLADKDKLRAAGLWQHYLHYMLKTNTGFTDVSGYVETVHLIHRQRALCLLEAQRVDEALREIEQAQAAFPGDFELVEKAMPLLMRAGRTEDAERLFADAYDAYDKVCRDFPKSASHHNSLAWLCARCDKRLGDALSHAQQAVQLDSHNMAYVDTLAEVHFRRGDVQRAMELAKMAAQREPNNKHYREQLRRFSQGN